MHERTHLRRADWAIAVLSALNRCIFWFHPLAWWLEHRLAELAEEACDDATVLTIGNREQYAQTLLEMAREVTSRHGRLSFTLSMAGHGRVTKRIERVLDETRQIGALLSRRTWAVILGAVLPLLYIWAALQPARAIALAQTPRPSRPQEFEAKPASQPSAVPPKEAATEKLADIGLTQILGAISLAPSAYEVAQTGTIVPHTPPSLFRQAEAIALSTRAAAQPNETTAVESLAEFYSSAVVQALAGVPGYASPDDLREAQASLQASSDGWVLQRTAAMLIESGFRGGAPASVRVDWQQYPNLSAAVAYGVHLMGRAQQFGEGGGGVIRKALAAPASSRYACEPPQDLRAFYFVTAKPAPDPAVPLHQALAADPENVFLNYWLVRSGSDVREEYRQKLQMHSNDPAYLFYFAQALMTGHWNADAALPYLERSVALAPDFPWNYPLLAHIHSIGTWADQTKLVQDQLAISALCPQDATSYQIGRVHDAAALRELAARYRNAVESRSSAGIGNYYPALWSSELRLTPAQQYRQYATQVAIDLARLRQIEGIDPNAMADGEALLAALEH